MDQLSKTALKIIQFSLLFAVIVDPLIRATPWGVNITLIAIAAFTVMAVLAKRYRLVRIWTGEGRWLCSALAFFSLAFLWRDSLTLKTIDALSILFIFCLLGLQIRGSKLSTAGVGAFILAPLAAALNAGLSFLEILLGDISWKDIPGRSLIARAGGIIKGILIAVPLLLIFTALLASADAMFQRFIQSMTFDPSLSVGHIFVILLVLWISAGFYRGIVAGREVRNINDVFDSIFTGSRDRTVIDVNAPVQPPTNSDLFPRLAITEVTVVLASVNLLFLTFVLVQARYAFGGMDLVLKTAGLTYAEYARGGFFQLVIVAALVLPILLILHWLIRAETAAAAKRFKVLSSTTIILLLVIMASAFMRMVLYQRAYGMTELRLYTTAFMAWLALLFLCFILTVLRGRRERFAWSAAGTALFVITSLHALNPDLFILKVNLAHSDGSNRHFDACYNSGLSADAVPEMIDSLGLLNNGQRRVVSQALLSRWSTADRADWRTFSYTRWRAKKSVRENNTLLWQYALQPPSGAALQCNENPE
jgi:hypothetical protein